MSYVHLNRGIEPISLKSTVIEVLRMFPSLRITTFTSETRKHTESANVVVLKKVYT